MKNNGLSARNVDKKQGRAALGMHSTTAAPSPKWATRYLTIRNNMKFIDS
jgi:hypothetical protein